MNRSQKNLFIGSVIFLIIIVLWFLNLRDVQSIGGSIIGGLDPQRNLHLRAALEKESNSKLLKLLDHGDYSKMAVAASLLAERAPQDMFDAIAKKLQSPYKQIRISARRILPYINKEKSFEILNNDLKKYQRKDFDYKDTISILSYWKDPKVFSLLMQLSGETNAWDTAIASDFEDLGDSKAIPILEDLYKTIPPENNFSARMGRKRIEKAIATLESIKKQQASVPADSVSSVSK